MISNSEYSDLDIKYENRFDTPHNIGARETMRGYSTDMQDDHGKIYDELLSSQMKYMVSKNVKKYGFTNAELKSQDSEQVENFINIKRRSRANLIRDQFKYSPTFLQKNF